MSLDWTAIVVAVLALLGAGWTAYASRERARKPTLIDQAGQISTMAVEQMHRMAEEIEEMETEIAILRQRVVIQGRRIAALEAALSKLGTDPESIYPGGE